MLRGGKDGQRKGGSESNMRRSVSFGDKEELEEVRIIPNNWSFRKRWGKVIVYSIGLLCLLVVYIIICTIGVRWFATLFGVGIFALSM